MADERIHLAFHLIGQLRDDHVETVIDDRLALRLLHPRFPRVVQGLAAVLDREIDDRCRAPEGRGPGASLEIVGGRRAAKRHVEVRVDVDAPGQHVLAHGVDRFVGSHVESDADRLDLLILDEDVASILVDGGDNRAVLDQRTHASSRLSGHVRGLTL